MLKAITRQARVVDQKVKAYNAAQQSAITIAYFFDHLASEEDTAVMVTEEDFVEANKELVPSVSADELQHYNRVRQAFEGAGKKEEQKPKSQAQLAISNGPNGQAQFHIQGGAGKDKGKAAVPYVTNKASKTDVAESDEDDYVIRTEHIDMNGDNGASKGKGKGKGKGSATSGHGKGKSSVDIAEGGFGDGAQDEDLYE
jgi:peroxin-6